VVAVVCSGLASSTGHPVNSVVASGQKNRVET
jgi:hypothetical protein